ncbi:MAG TPA: alkyl sulfatase dimerization domain-containing protein [Sphingobium sp.]|uniref:alkyl sulfatase dimerization domain-containing protein n=1 Tax=Sphingobium sp. TaxID=1912891 RepID=UPI002ED15674
MTLSEPLYRQADHPRLKVNEWRAEDGAERVNDVILMSKGVTNCYVVTSDDGDVVINTGMPGQGQRHRERFEQLLGRPLKVSKIIFTQDHLDQTGGWEAFNDPGVDIVGQRELERIAEERARLGPFFVARNRRILRAIQEKIARESGTRAPAAPPKPVTLTTRFADTLAFEVGGRQWQLISTPSGETFNALAIWLPAEKVLFTGNFMSAVFGTMPNFYTLRGDRQRSVPGYLRELQQLIDLGAELLVTGHGEPRHGAGEIHAALSKIRDAVTWMHDETIRRMVAGEDLATIMQAVELPPELRLSPLGRGPTRWYVRTIWEEYVGWFRQELTSELYATPASAIWPTLAEMAGGAPAVAKQAETFLQIGEVEKALHMIEIAVTAAPDDREVRTTEARILIQMINNTGGVGFDEIGWLEGKLAEARKIADPDAAPV